MELLDLNKKVKGVCLATNPSFGMDVLDQIAFFKQVGFDAFFTGINEDPIQCREQAEKCGIVYRSVHAPNDKTQFLWERSEGSREMTNAWIECVDDCANAAVPIMVLHPFRFVDRLGIPKDHGVENLLPVVERAAKRGVQIAIENSEGEDYLGTLLDAFADCDHVGFCWDTGHELCFNRGLDMMARFGHRLIATHINDNLGVRDPAGKLTPKDDLHYLPFDGVTNWESVAARLRGADYHDYVTLELKKSVRYEKMSGEEWILQAYERAHRILDMM